MAASNPPPEPVSPPSSNDKSGNKDSGSPSLLLNWVSLTGLLLFALGFFTGVFTALVDTMSEVSPAYLGVLYLAYLVLIVVGFVLIPIGMLRERRHRRPGAAPSIMVDLVIDLRKPRHRAILLGLFIGGGFLTVGMALGSYKTYQTTDSNAFCGQLCHSVMNPEWTTYQHSPHARVKCVECHIGSGAEWYVRSKLSGIRQVWAVNTDSYPRPIPTPIENLRPARETCEECHWPKMFIGFKEVVRPYYLSDKQNTPYRVRMLIKIGGEQSNFLMRGSGIHYHMLLANKVEYRARDARRQDIPWVRIVRADGSVTLFEDTDNPMTEKEMETAEPRTMDCMDCHNRPAHQYPSPMTSVDQALNAGVIARDLPYIKLESVKALSTQYNTTPAAMNGIASELRNYYDKNYPEVLSKEGLKLTEAIREVQSIYKRSIFPEMKADWAAYPDNIGHRDWPGCFRCHNDHMASADGKTIFTDCTKCHLILAQGKDVNDVDVNLSKGLAFVHPADGEQITEFTQCNDCHTGDVNLYE